MPGKYSSPEEKPPAPSSKHLSTSRAICATSSGSPARSSSPRTARWIVPWPTKAMTFTPRSMDSSVSRYSPKPSQPGCLALSVYQGATARMSLCAQTGAQEMPHWPITSVVTPWCTWLSARPSAIRVKSECVCMSTNPGDTTSPETSITRAACSGFSAPISAIRVPVTATSATRPSAPVPS
jgi:hypothetical protein